MEKRGLVRFIKSQIPYHTFIFVSSITYLDLTWVNMLNLWANSGTDLKWLRSIEIFLIFLSLNRASTYSQSVSNSWQTVADHVKTTEFTVKDLRPNTVYLFIIRAVNAQGLGDPSPMSDPVRTQGTTNGLCWTVSVDFFPLFMPVPLSTLRHQSHSTRSGPPSCAEGAGGRGGQHA